MAECGRDDSPTFSDSSSDLIERPNVLDRTSADLTNYDDILPEHTVFADTQNVSRVSVNGEEFSVNDVPFRQLCGKYREFKETNKGKIFSVGNISADTFKDVRSCTLYFSEILIRNIPHSESSRHRLAGIYDASLKLDMPQLQQQCEAIIEHYKLDDLYFTNFLELTEYQMFKRLRYVCRRWPRVETYKMHRTRLHACLQVFRRWWATNGHQSENENKNNVNTLDELYRRIISSPPKTILPQKAIDDYIVSTYEKYANSDPDPAVLQSMVHTLEFIKYWFDDYVPKLQVSLDTKSRCTTLCKKNIDKGKRCKDCRLYIKYDTTLIGNTDFKLAKENININCGDKNVVYLMGCNRCPAIYVGQATTTLRDRFSTHKTDIKNRVDKVEYQHFHLPGHKGVEDVWIQGIDKVDDVGSLTDREMYWVWKLGSNCTEYGLNIDIRNPPDPAVRVDGRNWTYSRGRPTFKLKDDKETKRKKIETRYKRITKRMSNDIFVLSQTDEDLIRETVRSVRESLI